MQIYTIVKTESGSLEGKLSEFCRTSPFVPVQVGLITQDEVKMFYKEAMVRREDSSLERVDYQAIDGTSLSLINDL